MVWADPLWFIVPIPFDQHPPDAISGGVQAGRVRMANAASPIADSLRQNGPSDSQASRNDRIHTAQHMGFRTGPSSSPQTKPESLGPGQHPVSAADSAGRSYGSRPRP